MIVKTYAGRQYTVDIEQANKVTKAIGKGTKFIKINGSLLAVSDIRAVEPGGYTEADVTKQIDKPTESTISGSLKERLKKTNPETYKKLYG